MSMTMPMPAQADSPFGAMASARRLSPACRSGPTLATAQRRRSSPHHKNPSQQLDLAKMRELARSDEFSDSESDGSDVEEEDVKMDDDEDDADFFSETMFVSPRRHVARTPRSMKCTTPRTQMRMMAQQKKKPAQDFSALTSPKVCLPVCVDRCDLVKGLVELMIDCVWLIGRRVDHHRQVANVGRTRAGQGQDRGELVLGHVWDVELLKRQAASRHESSTS